MINVTFLYFRKSLYKTLNIYTNKQKKLKTLRITQLISIVFILFNKMRFSTNTIKYISSGAQHDILRGPEN